MIFLLFCLKKQNNPSLLLFTLTALSPGLPSRESLQRRSKYVHVHGKELHGTFSQFSCQCEVYFLLSPLFPSEVLSPLGQEPDNAFSHPGKHRLTCLFSSKVWREGACIFSFGLHVPREIEAPSSSLGQALPLTTRD